MTFEPMIKIFSFKYIIILTFITLVLIFFVKFSSAAEKPVETSLPTSIGLIGQLAPNFGGEFLSGESFRLEDYIGKDMIILNFFTTYCGPCRIEIPELNHFYNERKGKNLQLIGIDIEENPRKVRSFVERMHTTFPVTVDNGALKNRLNINGFPVTVVIGVDGLIQYEKIGVVNIEQSIEPLYKANLALLKKKKQVSVDAFLARHKQEGNKFIEVTPPQVNPIPGYVFNPNKSNKIFDINVVLDNEEELHVEVDYYYDGSHGDKRNFIDCYIRSNDKSSAFGNRPATAPVGRHKVITPQFHRKGCLTNEIECKLTSRFNSEWLASKTIPYKKRWKNCD